MAGAAACCAIALAACGGAHSTDGGSRRAALPHALSHRLAAASERVATTLDAGDPCGAARQADAVRAEAEAAIAAGRVPAALRGGLGIAVRRLDARVNCPPPPPPTPEPPPPPDRHANEPAKHHDKKPPGQAKKKHGNHKDGGGGAGD